MTDRPIIIATRGSALALAQSNFVMGECRRAFPGREFRLSVIKTTGDKLQAVPATTPSPQGTKGLFTKELEVALLNGEADFAVHSLKDLPTELPEGLTLGAVGKREDVRDVLIYRGPDFAEAEPGAKPFLRLPPNATLRDFPPGGTIATSSTRRQAQVLGARPDLRVVPIRGNVGTRLQKLAAQPELDGLILALAGLTRLHFKFDAAHRLGGEGIPAGLCGEVLEPETMLPCVGQGALGIETRENDPAIAEICRVLNDAETEFCVKAERAFLKAMGGGCLSPVAAYGDLREGRLRLRAISFRDGAPVATELTGPPAQAEELGRQAAQKLSR